MELKFDIEDAMMEANALRSLLLAVTDSACNSGYTFDTYETAFDYISGLASDHYKHLKELTERAFALRDNEKVLNIQAERKVKHG